MWSALPGPTWPAELAAAVQACAAAGRGAVVVLPDARDVARLAAALTGACRTSCSPPTSGPPSATAAGSPSGAGRCGSSSGRAPPTWAPVADLGLVAVWDDGDDLHAEPRAPYCTVRDVLVLRAHLAGAAALVGGLVRTAEGQQLVDTGWARALEADRDAGPRRRAAGRGRQRRRPRPRPARPRRPAARSGLRRGPRGARPRTSRCWCRSPAAATCPRLACARDRTPARCAACAGPLTPAARAAVAGLRLVRPARRRLALPGLRGSAPAGRRRRRAAHGRGAGPGLPRVRVRTSGRDEVLTSVPQAAGAGRRARPGAEPVAEAATARCCCSTGGPCSGGPSCGPARRRCAAGRLPRRSCRPAGEGGRVVVVADRGLVPVQALVRWDPAGAAARELAARASCASRRPTRMAAVDGPAEAVADLLADLAAARGRRRPGPGPVGRRRTRCCCACPREHGVDARRGASRPAAARRSARKAEPLRVELDPAALL